MDTMGVREMRDTSGALGTSCGYAFVYPTENIRTTGGFQDCHRARRQKMKIDLVVLQMAVFSMS